MNPQTLKTLRNCPKRCHSAKRCQLSTVFAGSLLMDSLFDVDNIWLSNSTKFKSVFWQDLPIYEAVLMYGTELDISDTFFLCKDTSA